MTKQSQTTPRYELTLAEAVTLLAWGYPFSSQEFVTADAAEIYRREFEQGRAAGLHASKLADIESLIGIAEQQVKRFEGESGLRYGSVEFDKSLDAAHRRLWGRDTPWSETFRELIEHPGFSALYHNHDWFVRVFDRAEIEQERAKETSATKSVDCANSPEAIEERRPPKPVTPWATKAETKQAFWDRCNAAHTPPTKAEDERWGKNNGISRDYARELRRQWRKERNL